jgi:hypothetical protein
MILSILMLLSWPSSTFPFGATLSGMRYLK